MNQYSIKLLIEETSQDDANKDFFQREGHYLL